MTPRTLAAPPAAPRRPYAASLLWIAGATLITGAACDPSRDNESTCAQLFERYSEAVLELDGSCTTASDCTLVGGVSSCECGPYLGPSCWGHPVNRTALADADATLDALGSEIRARCSDLDPRDVPGACDCEPWATPTCEAGRCGYDVGSWCLGVADAGPTSPAEPGSLRP